MLQGSQPNTSRASSDSANIVEGTATNLGKVWSPLDVRDCFGKLAKLEQRTRY